MSYPTPEMVSSSFLRTARALLKRPTIQEPLMSELDAYRLQGNATAIACAQGHTIIGYKIGLTSASAQQSLGATQPTLGVLFDDMVTTIGRPGIYAAGEHFLPRLEPEIAFRFGNGLPAGSHRVDDVLNAATALIPAIEVVDSRYGTWDINYLDLICDNGASAGVLLAADDPLLPPSFAHQPFCCVRRNGVLAASASASSPEAPFEQALSSVVWLAQMLESLGSDGLEKGSLVLSGTLTEPVDLRPGDHFEIEMDASRIFDLSIVVNRRGTSPPDELADVGEGGTLPSTISSHTV